MRRHCIRVAVGHGRPANEREKWTKTTCIRIRVRFSCQFFLQGQNLLCTRLKSKISSSIVDTGYGYLKFPMELPCHQILVDLSIAPSRSFFKGH